MPKKIVLIEPEYGQYEFDYLPQGLLSIAAILDEYGHDVSVYKNPPLPNCDILGISATISQYNRAIGIAKEADAGTIVIGGAFATTSPVEAIASSVFDIAIVGDGEGPMLEIAENTDRRNIPGVVYVDKTGLVIMNPNLDYKYMFRDRSYPIPPYELFHGEIGESVNVTRNREYSWSWRWFRKNKAKLHSDFQKEISTLLNYGVKHVHVTDEHFGDWHDNIKTTINSLDRLDSWSCNATTEVVLKRRLDQKLCGSKCNMLELDIKTASGRMLAELGDTTIEDHDLAMELLQYAGINVRVHATLGMPGETIDSMMETWHWLRGKRARLTTFTPLPGTTYYESCESYDHFGFDIIGTNRCDFIIDDSGPLHYIPWSSSTIEQARFISMRNEMVEELVMNHG